MPLAVAQLAQQLQHLGLHGHVQGAGRLVGQQHLGAQREGERDRDPLQLAAGQLRRVAVQQVRARAARCAWPRRPAPLASAPDRPCCRSARDTIAPDPEHRVERQRRALEDGRDPPPADRPQPGGGQPDQLLAVQPDCCR